MTRRPIAGVLDEAELRQRLAAQLAESGIALDELRLVPAAPGGGNSGITCLAQVSGGDLGDRFVVKVAPPGLPPVRNRDVIRQARLLGALARDGRVPVPDVVLISPGDPPDLPPAVVMRFVEGEAIEPGLEQRRPPAEVIRARSLSAARLLAVLHSLDADRLGLTDEPALTLRDELDTWSRAFDSVEEAHQAGHGTLRPLLLSTMPAGIPTAVCHGDYRLGNMLCSGPDIGAIIDWEIWSRTDPRLDLSWLLWISDPAHPSSLGPVDGMPSADELVGAYVAAGGRSLPAAERTWFRAFTCYKQAATVALLAKHGRRKGDGTSAGFEQLAPRLTEQAKAILERPDTA
jgi:aminoglycoside phosphotransferase (APT) family kinase protein